jgi:hypothetical protein
MSEGMQGASSVKSSAAYDPFSASIWLPYEPEAGTLAFSNPQIAHEVAHYGQNVFTRRGIEELWSYHELYSATCTILRDERQLSRPLRAVSTEQRHSEAWGRASACLDLLKLSSSYSETRPEFGSHAVTKIIEASFTHGSRNPFAFHRHDGRIAFCVDLGSNGIVRIPIDGAFVKELHACSVEFFLYWVEHKLTFDEAVEFFLHHSRSVFALVLAMVHKWLIERFGANVAAVHLATTLVYLCAFVALNSSLVITRAHPIHNSSGASDVAQTGDVDQTFVRALQLVLAWTRNPAWNPANFRPLLDRLLRTVAGTDFRTVIVANLARLSGLEAVANRARGDPHSDFIALRCDDSRSALNVLIDVFTNGTWIEFVTVIGRLIADHAVSCPLIVGPDGPGELHERAVADVSGTLTKLRGFYLAVLTRKLWTDGNLSCDTWEGAPIGARLLQKRMCEAPLCIGTRDGRCTNVLWAKNILSTYPFLTSAFPDLVS